MRVPEPIRGDRCSAEDYRRMFTCEAAQLQWLCDTLTGDEHRSRLSFDDALNRSLESASGVFREWMTSWARRAVIKSCVGTMQTEIRSAARKLFPFQTRPSAPDVEVLEQLFKMAPETFQAKLLSLDVLSRFVLVLRMLENYSRRETALLLEVDETICDSAQSRAAAYLVGPESNANSNEESDGSVVTNMETRGSYDYRRAQPAFGSPRAIHG